MSFSRRSRVAVTSHTTMHTPVCTCTFCKLFAFWQIFLVLSLSADVCQEGGCPGIRLSQCNTEPQRVYGGEFGIGDCGTLEVFHSGKWGFVCDDSFDKLDARVACRQLCSTLTCLEQYWEIDQNTSSWSAKELPEKFGAVYVQGM